MTQGSPKKQSALPIVLIVAVAAIPVVIAIIGVMATLAIYGVSRYLKQAKLSEARHATMQLAHGIALCADTTGALPRTSPAVPAIVPSANKYMSAASDWSDPTFSCARFSMSVPQYFRYQWIATSPTTGTVRADADLTGSGAVTNSVEIDIHCTPGATLSCAVGTPREKL